MNEYLLFHLGYYSFLTDWSVSTGDGSKRAFELHLKNSFDATHAFDMHPKLYTPSTLNIQMKLILLWVWAERAVLGRAKTALKFKYEI